MTRRARPIVLALVALCTAPLALRPLAESGHSGGPAASARVRDRRS